MNRPYRSLALLALTAMASLAGCIPTPRPYSAEELGLVARRCELAVGEVVQEPDEIRLLFLYAVAPGPRRVACVQRWSRRHGLHFVHVELPDPSSE